MFCPSCGKKIPDNSSFCPECGKPIVRNQQKASGAGSTQAAPVQQTAVPKPVPSPQPAAAVEDADAKPRKHN